jgi:hypothetical protein
VIETSKKLHNKDTFLIHTYFNIDKYWLANYSLAMFIPDDEPYCA